jgi:enoyl-CoA hydratase/carnithine racemase
MWKRKEDPMPKDYADMRAAILRDLDGLRYEVDAQKQIGWLVLDRPPLNIVSYRGRSQINAIMEAFGQDPEVRVVVIRGANGTYTSGGDVKAFPDIETDGMSHLAWNIAAPERCPKPVVCAMEKYAMGVGLELAMACDIRIAAQSASFGQPEISLGIIPGFGGTQRLPRLIGEARALEMNLTGEPISAQVAYEYGLANRVVPDHELWDTALAWAHKLSDQAPRAVKQIKRVSAAGDLDAGIEAEKQAFAKVFGSEDAREGITAFLQKRKPSFRGK